MWLLDRPWFSSNSPYYLWGNRGLDRVSDFVEATQEWQAELELDFRLFAPCGWTVLFPGVGVGSPPNSEDRTLWKSCFLSPQWQWFGSPGLGRGILALRMYSVFRYWPVSIFTTTLWGRQFCSHSIDAATVAQNGSVPLVGSLPGGSSITYSEAATWLSWRMDWETCLPRGGAVINLSPIGYFCSSVRRKGSVVGELIRSTCVYYQTHVWYVYII